MIDQDVIDAFADKLAEWDGRDKATREDEARARELFDIERVTRWRRRY